jgi:hypothetical protein
MRKMASDTHPAKESPPLNHFQDALRRAQQLVIYRKILADPIVSAFLKLLDCVTQNKKATPKRLLKMAEAYASFFSGLALKVQASNAPRVGTPLQNHLMELILTDENVFSSTVQQSGLTGLGDSLLRQVELDLRKLQTIYRLNGQSLLKAMENWHAGAPWLNWDDMTSPEPVSRAETIDFQIKHRFLKNNKWEALLPVLADHYLKAGCGIFGQYRAFHWKSTSGGGFIVPIHSHDPIRLEELIGCDDQKNWLVRNTEAFLSGYPANNIFVYGDRGTGKSSAIKALLNYFEDRPLRMIEISRDDLMDLPDVMKLVKNRPQFFVIFVDDLSFEEGETQYKTLKAVLEGSLEARPRNVLIYATSNRRHLIREYFSDRDALNNGEVRHQDTLQEKVSLADRFGIQLVFIAPDQNQYLAIVRSMVRRRRLEVTEDDLTRRALQWVQLHNARSGRTARQFVDYLTAELHMGGPMDR